VRHAVEVSLSGCDQRKDGRLYAVTPPLVIEDQNMTVTFEIAKDGEE